MPVALAPVIAGAGLVGGVEIAGVTVSFASIAANAIGLGVTVGGAFLLQALTKKQHVDSQVTTKQASPARIRAYGRCKLGGAMYFMNANYQLIQGFVHCEGPIAEVEQWWLNDIPCGISEGLSEHYNTANIYPWYQQVAVYTQLGRADQTANPMISNVFGAWWTPDHRLRGLANTVMQCILPPDPSRNFSQRFPSGVPALRIVARCSPVYDPRDGAQNWSDPDTWKWSDNSGLCILDYLTSSRGFNIPRSRINLTSFVAFADLCDQSVPSSSGNPNVARYRCWGSYSLDEQPIDVLRRLLATCDGEVVQLADGTVGLRGGEWDPPSVTINDSTVLAYEVHQGNDRLSAFNQLRIRYTEPSQDYQQIECDPYDDVDAQESAGEVVPQDLDLAMVPNFSQALRLAAIVMAKGNPRWLITLTCTLAALNALGERTVHLTLAELGIDEDFFVSKFTIAGDLKSVEIAIGSLSAAAYTWEGTTAQGPATPASGDTSVTIPAVTGLALSLASTSPAPGALVYNVLASIAPPADDTLALSLIAQISPDDGATWLDMFTTGAWSASSNVVANSTTYTVRAAFQTYGGTIGAYTIGTIKVSYGSLGLIAQALSVGTNEDYGLASAAVTTSDDFGLASSAATIIDLGLASS